MNFCTKCGAKLEKAGAPCPKCAVAAKEPAPAGLAYAPPPERESVATRRGFLESFTNPELRPGLPSGLVFLFLSFIASFAAMWATVFRSITGGYGRDIGRGLAFGRAILAELSWGSAFAATVLHLAAAFCILVAATALAMAGAKPRNGGSWIGGLRALAALAGQAHIPAMALGFATAAVAFFLSPDWGIRISWMPGFPTARDALFHMPGDMAGAAAFMPNFSLIAAASVFALLALSARQVYAAPTARAAFAAAAGVVASWAYQAFAAERILQALFGSS